MNLWRQLQARFRALLGKQKLDAELDEEIRLHIEMRTQEKIKAGLSPEEARYAALRQFGWVESIKETRRDQRGVGWIEHLVQDVRYGVRMLRMNPGFTAVTVLTLALGIGANTAIFSVVDGVLLKPLHYDQPGQLVQVWEAPSPGKRNSVSPGVFLDWKQQSVTFDSLAASNSADLNLTGIGEHWRPAAELPAVGKSRVCHPLRLRAWTNKRDGHWLRVLGRVKSNVTIEQGHAELNSISERSRALYPAWKKGWGATVVPMHEQLTGTIKPTLLVLLGAVGCVLLIACANVANLLQRRARRFEGGLRNLPFRCGRALR